MLIMRFYALYAVKPEKIEENEGKLHASNTLHRVLRITLQLLAMRSITQRIEFFSESKFDIFIDCNYLFYPPLPTALSLNHRPDTLIFTT